jgi:hypothetical protein
MRFTGALSSASGTNIFGADCRCWNWVVAKSLATPTMSYAVPPATTRLPSGARPGKSCRASAPLTMATRLVAVSRDVKSRPD